MAIDADSVPTEIDVVTRRGSTMGVVGVGTTNVVGVGDTVVGAMLVGAMLVGAMLVGAMLVGATVVGATMVVAGSVTVVGVGSTVVVGLDATEVVGSMPTTVVAVAVVVEETEVGVGSTGFKMPVTNCPVHVATSITAPGAAFSAMVAEAEITSCVGWERVSDKTGGLGVGWASMEVASAGK
jgi:hypothetical protein